MRSDRRRMARHALAELLTVACCAAMLSAATPSLLLIQRPREGEVVGVRGVEVVIRFPRERRVETETFRALLNGADITSELTTGANGAAGRLFGVLDGDNTLRIRVSGDRGGVPYRILEDVREVHFLVRQPQDVNRG